MAPRILILRLACSITASTCSRAPDRASADLRLVDDGEVVCCWRYASIDEAVRGLLCSAGGARAIQAAGEQAVRDVLLRSLAEFEDPQTAVVTLANTFRWVAACR